MNSPGATPPRSSVTGHHVLAGMLVFFAAIIAADATMIYKAISTFGGVDNANAYREGLAYNDRIDRARRQSGLGWRDEIEVRADPMRLRVRLIDSHALPLTGFEVEAKIGRPATIRADVTLPLIETSPGSYEAALGAAIGQGAWIASVSVRQKDDASDMAFQSRRRIWVTR